MTVSAPGGLRPAIAAATRVVVKVGSSSLTTAAGEIDDPAARERADHIKPDLEKRGYQVFEISAATGEGLRPLGFAMAEIGRAHV